MTRALEAAKADAQDLSRKSINYNVMEREAKSNRQVYEALLQRGNELRVSSNNRANNVRVIDHAEVPKAPMTPTGRRTWLVSMMMGLFLAVAVAYGLDYMNDTIKTPEDITRRLKMTLIGLVPSVPSDPPSDPRLRARTLRFREVFGRWSLVESGVGNKTIVVTSAQPLEGKTTTAANIALALAYSGGAQGALLIDADMRRPGPPSTATPHERAGVVSGADGPGARARCDPAHGGARICSRSRQAGTLPTRQSCCRPSA